LKYIKLTKGHTAIIDDEDYEKVSEFKWCYHNQGYAAGRRNKKYLLMHRIILEVTDPKVFIDHIDCNKLNNQKNNLRIVTHQLNQANRPRPRQNTSNYKGVSLVSYSKTWRARIMFNYKEINLGTYASKHEAAKAYNKKALELFGEYAYLNKIEGE